MSIIGGVFLAYLLILFVLAAVSRKESQSLGGYYLAGKKLPGWVVAFSTNATGESGWLLLGLTGMGYAVGAQAFWVVLGEVTGIACSWFLISRRLKRLADAGNCITVPDVLAYKLNDTNNILRSVSVIVILGMVCAYVAAQTVAAGKTFSGFLDMSYEMGVLLGATVIIAYTSIGGYKAVAYTDVVQGLLMLLVLIIVPTVAIHSAGGWSAMIETLSSQGLTDLFRATPSDQYPWIFILSFLAIGLPFLGVPQLMTRFMSARSDADLVKASWISILVILVFDTGAVLTGMAGQVLYPGLTDPEGILPLLSDELFPQLIAGLIMVTVLAAIMSTADSLLLLASSALVRDFLQKTLKSSKSDQTLARYGKAATLVIGVAAVVFALGESPIIFWFVLFAWSGLGAAFGPVILSILFFRRTNLSGAIAGVVGGAGTTVVWVLFLKERFYDLYEMIPGFLVGLALTIGVSLASGSRDTKRPADSAASRDH